MIYIYKQNEGVPVLSSISNVLTELKFIEFDEIAKIIFKTDLKFE